MNMKYLSRRNGVAKSDKNDGNVVRCFSRTEYDSSFVPERTRTVVLAEGKRFDFDSNEETDYFFRKLSHPLYSNVRHTIENVVSYMSSMHEKWRKVFGRNSYGRSHRQAGI